MSEQRMDGPVAVRARGALAAETKLGPWQVKVARYEEAAPDGHRAYTVAQIAAEFGVGRPTIYRDPYRNAASVLTRADGNVRTHLRSPARPQVVPVHATLTLTRKSCPHRL